MDIPVNITISLINCTGRRSHLEVPSSYCVADLKKTLILGRNMLSDSINTSDDFNLVNILSAGQVLVDDVRLSDVAVGSVLLYSFDRSFPVKFPGFDLRDVTRQLVQLTSVDVPLARHRHHVGELQREASASIMRAWCKLSDPLPFSPSVDAISDSQLLVSSISESKEYIRLQSSCSKILSQFRGQVAGNHDDIVGQFADDILALCALTLGDADISGIQFDSSEPVTCHAICDVLAYENTPSLGVINLILKEIISCNLCTHGRSNPELLKQHLSFALSMRNYADFGLAIHEMVSYYRSLFSHPTSGLLPVPNLMTVESPDILRLTRCLKRLR